MTHYGGYRRKGVLKTKRGNSWGTGIHSDPVVSYHSKKNQISNQLYCLEEKPIGSHLSCEIF
jgi:hypothetical protein